MQKRGMAVVRALGLLVFGIFALSISTGVALGQTKTLKIGLVNSVTGPMAPGFRSVVEAARPAQDLINARGGVTVKGQKYLVEIETVDDQSTPAGAVAATNKLLQSGVKYIIAPIFIPNFMASAPISEEAKVLRVLPASIDPLLFGPPRAATASTERRHITVLHTCTTS